MKYTIPLPSFQLADSMLDYNPDTGIFIYKARKGNRVFNLRYAHKQAGATDDKGYRKIKVGKKLYQAHRLAFLLMTGRDIPPGMVIDHRNGQPDCNVWSNLRLATNSQNAANSKLYASNSSGTKGVSWHKRNKKWVAYVRVDDVLKNIGAFADINEAISARKDVAEDIFGQFAKH